MFLKTLLMSALAFPLLTGSVLAQQAPPPAPQDAPIADAGPGKRPPPPPPAPAGEYAAFDIQLGRGAGIHISCGKDDINTCVEAASPLLEKAQGMLDQGLGGPPPPPKKP